MQIITRAEAKAAGLKQFFNGIPCKHGHVAARATVNSSCMECMRIRAAARYHADPEKALLATKRRKEKPDYKEKLKAYVYRKNPARAAKMAVVNADREARSIAMASGEVDYISHLACTNGHAGKRFAKTGKCVECVRTTRKQQYVKRRDLLIYKECQRRYYEGNREVVIKRSKDWGIQNPDKLRACKKANQAYRRAGEKAGDAPAVILAWEKSAKKVCYWCNTKCADEYHIDHYQPLSRGGEHRISNLVIACPTCNLRKNAKDPLEFAASVGRLF